MAYEQIGVTDSAPASADLSASQYCAVVKDSNGNLAVAGAAVRIYGVLQNRPKATQAGSVVITGVSKMVMGADNIAAGTALMTDGSGRAVAQTTTNPVIGILSETAGLTGTLGSVRLSG